MVIHVCMYILTGSSHPRWASFAKRPSLMLLLLLCSAQFIASLILCMVSKNLFVSFDDALWGDVLSNSPHSLTYLVASKFEIVAGIICLLTNGSACPLPLCALVAFYHWWPHQPLHCQFALALVVASAPFCQGWFVCRQSFLPWCIMPPVLLLLLITLHFW